MGEFSLPHLIIVLAIILLLFGPSKLADLGASLGKGVREFRKSIRELDDTKVTPSNEETSRIETTGLQTQIKPVEKQERN